MKPPYSQNWNFSIERHQIAHDYLLDVRYVGNKERTWKPRFIEANPSIYGPRSQCEQQ